MTMTSKFRNFGGSDHIMSSLGLKFEWLMAAARDASCTAASARLALLPLSLPSRRPSTPRTTRTFLATSGGARRHSRIRCTGRPLHQDKANLIVPRHDKSRTPVNCVSPHRHTEDGRQQTAPTSATAAQSAALRTRWLLDASASAHDNNAEAALAPLGSRGEKSGNSRSATRAK